MRITIIGSGNVATHLGAALKNAGHRIIQVYSRDINNAAILGYHIGAEPIADLQYIDIDTDVFIISVKDDVIPEMVRQLTAHQKLILHTSGATDMQVIIDITDKAGVLYPLQTFSKVKEVDLWSVPLCIEGASADVTAQVRELASTISNNIYEVDSAGRKILHLAAVFACNFPNYLYAIAQDLLEKHQLDFNMIRPLIAETADKAMQRMPAQVQTGPAVRNDVSTMSKHLQLLAGETMWQEIYELLSQGIIKMDKKG